VGCHGGYGAYAPYIYRNYTLTAGGASESTTDGATVAKYEFTGNGTDYYRALFTVGDTTQWTAELPQGYLDGTSVYVSVKWGADGGNTSQTTTWKFYAKAIGDNQSLDGSWGSGVSISDTYQTADYQNISAESAAYTIENTPNKGDTLQMMLELDATTVTGNVSCYMVKVKFTGE
jgi:hypothetical protein